MPWRLTDSPKRQWFQELRRSLGILATVSTNRRTIEQPYLDDVMPRMLGEPITTTAPAPWVTTHGDLHWANLCGPTLCMLDWEGWGLAPAGYDAATLYCHSLLMPTLSAQVQARFADALSTESGRCGVIPLPWTANLRFTVIGKDGDGVNTAEVYSGVQDRGCKIGAR
ncbi:phosphotransferase, partial [Parafrankia sp. FMc2]|uniref:phosphotransferase n=1 Tax=Parafrankia sp. FMc2 TaxID=3233196 RepID=UPI0034D5931E